MAVTDEEKAVREANGGWLDDNPFYLVIILEDGRNIEQDLAERGWIAKLNEAGWLRAPGSWYLVRKASGAIRLMMLVREGEQPYYVKHHAGFITDTVDVRGSAYGIGKKRADGHTDRLWILPNDCVVTGDDVDDIIIRLLKQGILPPWTP